jgi:hypothetical protein
MRAAEKAETRGHWLAAGILRAWIRMSEHDT